MPRPTHPQRPSPPLARLLLPLLVLPALFLTGCYRTVVRDGWADLAKQADNSRTAPKKGAAQARGWTIALDEFTGDGAQRQAKERGAKLLSELMVPDLWIRQTGGAYQLCRGQYAAADDERAREDLRQTRMLIVDGLRPYGKVELLDLGTPSGVATGDALDLRQFPGAYTLQIGYYDEQMGPEFRQSAEQAARALRQDGAEAYFYHGPNRSLLTVGLFSDADFVLQDKVWAYGPRIKTLQEKFPYNLGNGRVLHEKINGKSVGQQQSCLVQVNP